MNSTTMQIAVDISLYPLQDQYEPPIVDFIRELRRVPELRVHTNDLSTQLTGDHRLVMAKLGDAMEKTFANAGTCSFVLKVLNIAIDPGKEVAIE